MNTRPPIESDSGSTVLSVGFNQDSSCFAVGTSSGMAVYHSQTCTIKAARDFNAGIGLVRMVDRTQVHALVGGGANPRFSQNRVIVWDNMKAKIWLEITTLTAVRGVQLNRERIVVILQNSVRIYKLAKPAELLTVHETADNFLGLCALSDSVAAFPGAKPGHVKIEHLGTGTVSIIPAHSSALRALVLSQDGEMVATASEQGTLIRIFSSQTCAKLAEIRRGIEPARIFSLAFSPSNAMIACTSDRGTLHVFDVAKHSSRRTLSETATRPSARPDSSPMLSGATSGTLPPPSDDETSVISAPSSSHGGEGTMTVPQNQSKWGILGKIPLMPRVFRDQTSFATAEFDASDDGYMGSGGMAGDPAATLGTGTRPIKGIIGWVADDVLIVVGGGRVGKWERFLIRDAEPGRRNIGVRATLAFWQIPIQMRNVNVDFYPDPDPLDGALAQNLQGQRLRMRRLEEAHRERKRERKQEGRESRMMQLKAMQLDPMHHRGYLSGNQCLFDAVEIGFDEMLALCARFANLVIWLLIPTVPWIWAMSWFGQGTDGCHEPVK